MSINSIGEKLRKLREERKMPLRKVGALLDIDVAILSKMERGERRITREIVSRLAGIYEYSEEELIILFLSDRILYELEDEELGMEALKVAEERMSYLKRRKRKKY